jgi:hypothetical protein
VTKAKAGLLQGTLDMLILKALFLVLCTATASVSALPKSPATS